MPSNNPRQTSGHTGPRPSVVMQRRRVAGTGVGTFTLDPVVHAIKRRDEPFLGQLQSCWFTPREGRRPANLYLARLRQMRASP